MRTLLAVLMLATPLWAQVPGSPEGKEKARGFFRTGTQHYDLGEFADALNDFKEAYRFYEEPIFLFNIAQCHRQLGQKEPAIRFFKVYLQKSPEAANKVDVKEMIGKLEVALQEERKAQVGKPEGTLAPPDTKPETKPAEIKPTLEVRAAPPPKTPVYKKWWLWTAVGAVVVAGVGIGLGVGLSQPKTPTANNADLGTYRPF